ncbi:MAG: hypothetical protein LRY35_02120 [Clostridiales bacterium]|nr:hypothetical protein [Clostridiales bacterium]
MVTPRPSDTALLAATCKAKHPRLTSLRDRGVSALRQAIYRVMEESGETDHPRR